MADLTPAQRLMQGHNPTVEDTIDDEDVQHPPPSAANIAVGGPTASAPNNTASSSQVSAIARSTKGLDTQSEDAFPALGGPKSRAATAVPTAWGKKPASLATPDRSAGLNGATRSSNASSGTSTPASEAFTPPSLSLPAGRQSRAPAGQTLSLPGRAVEQIEFAPSQLMPRNQLKKPIGDVLREINKRSKAKVSMKEGANGKIIFAGEGNIEAVRLALKEVANQVGAKQTVKIEVPQSVRPHIIGRQGATIQNMSKRTGARINVPKQEDHGISRDDDDGTISVEIEGDPVSAEMARREIEAILASHTSNVSVRMQDVPPELYHFIAGPYNSRIDTLQQQRDVRIQIPQYYTWDGQAPPQPSSENGPVAFLPQPGNPIVISGERLAAQQARADIERLVEQLKQQLTLEAVSIDRNRHQFIAGDGGESLHDILEETGCTVILPPDSHDGEDVYVVGPASKILDGSNKVMDLSMSMARIDVDVNRLHQNAAKGRVNHALDLARYLHEREAMKEMEATHNAKIILPLSPNGPSEYQIWYRDGRSGGKARTDVTNLVAGHPPARLRRVEVNPYFHEHLRANISKSVREKSGVHMIFPDGVEESPQVLLVFESLDSPDSHAMPRGAPSAKELREFELGLQAAERDILDSIKGYTTIGTSVFDAPSRFHEKVRRHVARNEHTSAPSDIRLQVISGAQTKGGPLNLSNDTIAIRGPEDLLNAMAAQVQAFVEQELRDEKERSHITTFEYPQKYANYLIGKRGENINRLRDEFDVEIKVDDGKVQLQGPPAKAAAAKSHILAMAKKLEDEATHTLTIHPQYHRDLIGRSGGQVNRLQDRYNVRINFPRSATADDGNDAASDAPQPRSRNQAPNEVIVKGPKKGADEAREELLGLLQYLTENSHTTTVSVAQSQVPSLIGSGGREMENLRLATGAQIDVPKPRDGTDLSGRVEIKIKGSKTQVEAAKKQLQERAKTFDETIVRTIEVDRKYHGNLIGPQGSNIRDIIVSAGGSDDRRDLARTVKFPRQESEGNTIKVEGSKAVVDKIIASIMKTVGDRESQTTKILEISPDKHRLLIGRGGDTRRSLEAQFHISLDVPKQTATGASRSQVKIEGQPADVESAAAHILSLVKDQEGITVNVPRSCHHVIVGPNGTFFRRLRNDHKVTVDHAGQQPPPAPAKSAGKLDRTRMNGRSSGLPLITDDPSTSEETYLWDLVEHDPAADSANGDLSGEIPWVLRGNSDNVRRARAQLDTAIANAQKPSATGYLILPDPKYHRVIVGTGGSKVNSIRKETATSIQVPRGGGSGGEEEAIEIVGSKEDVERAKEIILELVQGSASGYGRRG